MRDPLQGGVIGNQVGAELLHPHDVRDEVIEGIDLHTLNVTRALEFGLLLGPLGDQCIRQILSGSDVGPLGKRDRR